MECFQVCLGEGSWATQEVLLFSGSKRGTQEMDSKGSPLLLPYKMVESAEHSTEGCTNNGWNSFSIHQCVYINELEWRSTIGSRWPSPSEKIPWVLHWVPEKEWDPYWREVLKCTDGPSLCDGDVWTHQEFSWWSIDWQFLQTIPRDIQCLFWIYSWSWASRNQVQVSTWSQPSSHLSSTMDWLLNRGTLPRSTSWMNWRGWKLCRILSAKKLQGSQCLSLVSSTFSRILRIQLGQLTVIPSLKENLEIRDLETFELDCDSKFEEMKKSANQEAIMKEDPSDYWLWKEEKFSSSLPVIARNLLSASPSSLPSERLFSISSLLSSGMFQSQNLLFFFLCLFLGRRNRILPSNLEMRVLLFCNESLLGPWTIWYGSFCP